MDHCLHVPVAGVYFTVLYVHLTVCSPYCMFTSLYVHLTVCSPHCMFTLLYVHLTVCSPYCMFTLLYVHLTVCSPYCMFTFPVCSPSCMFTLLDVHLTVCSPSCMFTFLYVHLPVCVLYCTMWVVCRRCWCSTCARSSAPSPLLHQYLLCVAFGFVGMPIAAIVKLIPVPKTSLSTAITTSMGGVFMEEGDASGEGRGDLEEPLLTTATMQLRQNEP